MQRHVLPKQMPTWHVYANSEAAYPVFCPVFLSCFFSLWHFCLLFFSMRHFCLILFFFADTYRSFFCWDISVICLTVLSKLIITVFISVYFQTFWPKWLNFFSVISKMFRSMTEKEPGPIWDQHQFSNKSANLNCRFGLEEIRYKQCLYNCLCTTYLFEAFFNHFWG